MPAHWRDACTVIARRSRDVLLRHPWTLDIADDPPLGPNSVRHFDQTLAAVASLDIPLADRLDIVTCVDEYVFGYCLNERNNLHDGGEADDEMKRYVESLIATGGYPQLSALAASMGLDAAWDQIAAHQRDDDRFERNLARVLDGIEASLARPGTGRPDPT